MILPGTESMSEIISLVLSPDHPCNTTITDSDTGKTQYTVVTEHEKTKSVTRIKNASSDELASYEWRDIQSDILTLANTKPIPSSTWLKKSIVPFKDTVTFTDLAGKKFKWKGNGPGLAFELYAEDNKSSPIARFHKSHVVLDKSTTPPSRKTNPAHLDITGVGLEMQDLIVISFLVLEKSRRANENSTMHRADVMGSAAINGGEGQVHKGGV